MRLHVDLDAEPGRLVDEEARRADPSLAEMEVVADRDAADAETPDQVMVNEILRAGTGTRLVEGHDHGAGEPGAGQKPQLGPLVRQAELWGVGAEKPPRMRLEGQSQGRAAMRPAHLQGCRDHGPMAKMNAVEIAHGDHGAPRNRGIRRRIADNGKRRGHQGNSRRGRTGPDRGATRPAKSSGGSADIERAISVLWGRPQLTRCLTP